MGQEVTENTVSHVYGGREQTTPALYRGYPPMS